jgi:uncharacterized protein (UPF0212 family)
MAVTLIRCEHSSVRACPACQAQVSQELTASDRAWIGFYLIVLALFSAAFWYGVFRCTSMIAGFFQ